VLVSGPAGVGKSRLGWELEKYVDGLAETVYWHRGSCPRFGEDTAYWALTEIVRARLGIGDDDDRAVIEDKLAIFLAKLFTEEAERAYVGGRLAPLLGLAVGGDLSRAELFAGWRRFFEGLAQQQPVLLLVEDLHDADAGLLDFLEHLVDWVRDLPVLVIGFTRPELVEERPGLGAGRNRTLINLAPLSDADMDELLAGLVDQMPAEAVAAIGSQAQGIPLFAVETVRSLIDQQVVVRTGEGYALKGDVGTLAVPDSLHALLAARLDALDPVARSLAADAAVIAAPFTAETLVDVSGLEPEQVHAGLSELAHRDVLQVSADVLSPQIGSYSFTHGLLAQVAYQTLSRRDLKDRHLRVAKHLAASTRNDGDALAEVIARHHLDALEARPNDDDVESLRAAGAEWLVRGADRARSTGAQATAARLFESAAELTGDADESHALRAADLWMHAAQAAYETADYDRTLAAADRAQHLRERYDLTRLVAVIQALRGRALRRLGRTDEALDTLQSALQVLLDEPGHDTVEVATALGGVASTSGNAEVADELTRQAITLAESLGASSRHLAAAFHSRALFLNTTGRRLEGIAHFRQAIAFAEAAGDVTFLPGPLGNLADAIMFASPREALALAQRAHEVSRQVGNRFFMALGLFNGVLCQVRLGQWTEAADAVETAIEGDGLGDIPEATWVAALVWTLRGEPGRAREIRQPLGGAVDDPQSKAYDELLLALLSQAEGEAPEALSHAVASLEALPNTSVDPYVLAWPVAARLAHEAGDRATMHSLLARLDAHRIGEIPPLVRAERTLAQARLVEDPVQRVSAIEDAVTELRAEGSPYHLALALLDLAEAQVAAGKDPADVVAEAATIGTTLGAPFVVLRARRVVAG
jgi:tetratricopeptide (TPR) repeat protein